MLRNMENNFDELFNSNGVEQNIQGTQNLAGTTIEKWHQLSIISDWMLRRNT